MCFGGSPKTPDIPAPPPPAPVPTPSEPTDVAAQTSDQRANQTKQLQYGILSTVKTGGAGVTGQGPDLVTAAAGGTTQKKTLGS